MRARRPMISAYAPLGLFFAYLLVTPSDAEPNGALTIAVAVGMAILLIPVSITLWDMLVREPRASKRRNAVMRTGAVSMLSGVGHVVTERVRPDVMHAYVDDVSSHEHVLMRDDGEAVSFDFPETLLDEALSTLDARVRPSTATSNPIEAS